jgi:hypothetical protein
MATDKKRLERLEKAIIFLAGGGAGFAAGRQGVVPAVRSGARLAVGTPQGRAVLAGIAAKELRDELNRRDDELAREELGNQIADILRIPRAITPAPLPLGLGITQTAKKLKKGKSKFNKAVSAGMKAVKQSTSYGKKGTVNNAKKAFTAVTKEASRINKGAKVAKSGIKRKIGLAIKKVLK